MKDDRLRCAKQAFEFGTGRGGISWQAEVRSVGWRCTGLARLIRRVIGEVGPRERLSGGSVGGGRCALPARPIRRVTVEVSSWGERCIATLLVSLVYAEVGRGERLSGGSG